MALCHKRGVSYHSGPVTNSMRVLKVILPLLVLAAGIGAFQYFKASKDKPERVQSEVKPAVVTVQTVSKAPVSPTLTLFGQVEAPNNATLSAAITAEVIGVSVLEGSAVQAGALLVELDATDVNLEILQRRAEGAEIEAQVESEEKRLAADRAALEREKALLAISRRAVERNRTLARSSAGTEANLDAARQQEEQQKLAITQRQLAIDDYDSRQRLLKARLDRASAALKRAQRDLGRTRVLAPFSGRVIDVMVSLGDRTSPGSQLVQLYDDSQLEVRTQVPSRYLPSLQSVIDSGQRLTAALFGNGNSATLELVRLAASVAQGQGGVDAFFRVVEGRLPTLGKTVEVALTLPPIDNVVSLSADSLYGSNRVYVVEEGVLRSRKIRRLGERTDENGELRLIVSGSTFEDNEQVLSSRLPQAIDGLRVEVTRQTAAVEGVVSQGDE